MSKQKYLLAISVDSGRLRPMALILCHRVKRLREGTALQMVSPLEMQIFLNRDKRHCSDGQSKLDSLHLNFARAQGHLPPSRCRTVTQSANLHKDRQIQQCTEKCKPDHRYPNPVRMEPIQRCADSGRYCKRANPNHQTETVESGKKGANTLQQGEEETRPGNCALSVASRARCPSRPRGFGELRAGGSARNLLKTIAAPKTRYERGYPHPGRCFSDRSWGILTR